MLSRKVMMRMEVKPWTCRSAEDSSKDKSELLEAGGWQGFRFGKSLLYLSYTVLYQHCALIRDKDAEPGSGPSTADLPARKEHSQVEGRKNHKFFS